MKNVSLAEARAQGLVRYFTGKPCKNGHISERYVIDRGCICCNRERDKRTPEQASEKWRRYVQDPVVKERLAEKDRRWIETHREAVRERNETWRKANPQKKQVVNRRWTKKELATNPVFRAVARLRTRFYKAVRGNYRGGSAVRDLGCSIAEFKVWMAGQFLPGMTWENYGPVWHVDHKIALSSFDLTDPARFREACHYTNLQPLFAADNRVKGPRYRPSLVNG